MNASDWSEAAPFDGDKTQGGKLSVHDRGNGRWELRQNGQTLLTGGVPLLLTDWTEPVALACSGTTSGSGTDAWGEYLELGCAFAARGFLGADSRIRLYARHDAVAISVRIRNYSADQAVPLRGIRVLQADLPGGDDFKVLGQDWERYYGAPSLIDAKIGRQIDSAWLIGIRAGNRNVALAAGAASANRMFTSLKAGKRTDGTLELTAEGDTRSGASGVRIEPGAAFESDPVLIAVAATMPDAVDVHSALIAMLNGGRTAKPRPVGWADWYYYYGNNSEQTVMDNARAIRERLAGYGVEYIQIDDGWQTVKEYMYYEPLDLTHTTSSGAPWEANGSFPGGMKRLAAEIRGQGFKAGIWIRPLSVMPEAEEFQQNVPWLIKQGHHMEGRACIDVSDGNALTWLRGLFAKLTAEWGFEWIKYDFIAYDLAGTMQLEHDRSRLPALLIGNKQMTSAQAVSDLLGALRQGAGERTYLLGVTGFAVSSLGRVDGYRISGDVSAFDWPLTKKMLLASATRWHQNRFWHNDPDVLLVDERLSPDEAIFWASFVALCGGILLLGDCIPKLPEERLQILKRILPAYPGCSRPVRAFAEEKPGVWHLPIRHEFGEWDTVGLFNWEESERHVAFTFRELGLAANRQYLLFDFWREEYVGSFAEGYSVCLPANRCQVLGIRAVRPVPQVLAAAHHIAQGGSGSIAEQWNKTTNTLGIVAKAVPGSWCKLFIWAPDGFEAQDAEADGTAVEWVTAAPGVVRIAYEASGKSSNELSIRFKEGIAT